jgi:lipase
MTTKPAFRNFELPDTTLGALHWPGATGAPTVIAIHGITANAWHFDPLAHRLAGSASLLSIDLRGRGRSHTCPGPFGIRRHAADIVHIVGELGHPVTVVGHSMGAYVALMAAERAPELFDRVVLVDGGAPLAEVDADGVDAALETTLGPALARLRTTWPDRVSYQTMWSQHPAFGDRLGIDLERDLLADLVEVDGGFRTAVNEEAVMVDGRDLLVDEAVRSLLVSRIEPTTILRAPNGLTGTPPPLIPDDVVSALPRHRWITVPDTNHYTILLGPVGAATVADTLRNEIGHH